MTYGERLLRRLGVLDPKDKLVRVFNWSPRFIGRDLCWPGMLIDRNGYRRESAWPVWDRTRIKLLFTTDPHQA